MTARGYTVQHSSVTGPTILTSTWSDLAVLPQPVFHRDEIKRLVGAQATPERFADVAQAKRIFRGAWVVAASRPLSRRRKKRPGFFTSAHRAAIPMPLERDE